MVVSRNFNGHFHTADQFDSCFAVSVMVRSGQEGAAIPEYGYPVETKSGSGLYEIMYRFPADMLPPIIRRDFTGEEPAAEEENAPAPAATPSDAAPAAKNDRILI